MNTNLPRFRMCFAGAVLAGLAAGCGGSANPVSPSPSLLSSDGTAAANAAATAIEPTAHLAVTQETGQPTPAELQSRGWTCLEPPIPNPPTVCSHPNQGFPAVADPLPPDRPATFTFWIFREDRFVGTELLIRSDLYKGQICESTGEPYFYASLIGYYECIHTPGK